jgi:hypothetical protein
MNKLKITSIRKNAKNDKEVMCNVADANEKAEVRRLKHWIVKVLILTLALLTTLVVLTFLYLSVTSKSSIKESTIGLFLQTLSEIIKIILAPV